MTWLIYRLWVWSYSLESIRESAHEERKLWTQAAACIGLAILRLWRRQ
jgi:hypothetical protein